MFGLGTTELIIILVLVMIVFGAGKLPQVAKSLGKGVREFIDGVDPNFIEEDEQPLESQQYACLERRHSLLSLPYDEGTIIPKEGFSQ